jgi:hypothetical protein
MSDELKIVEPSEALQRQIGPDENVEWVVTKEKTDVYLEALGAGVQSIVLGIFLGIFGAVFIGSIFGLIGGVIGFLLPVIGIPLLIAGLGIVVGLTGTIEYAATDQRFIMHSDSIMGTQTESVPIDRVRDVEYSEDMMDKILGNGDIQIEAERGADSISFDNVPNGTAFLKKVRSHAEM